MSYYSARNRGLSSVRILTPSSLWLVPRPQMLAEILAASGYAVTVMAPESGGSPATGAIAYQGYWFSSRWWPRKVKSLGLWLACLTILMARPSICIGFDSTIAPALIAKAIRRSLRVVAYHLEYYEPRLGMRGLWIRFLRRFERYADLVVDVDSTRLALRQKWTPGISDSVVIRNLAQKNVFAVSQRRSCSPVRFIYTGGVHSRYCIQRLIVLMHASHLDISLDLYCHGEESTISQLVTTIEKLYAGDRFRMNPPVSREDIAGLLAAYDVGVVWYPYQGLTSGSGRKVVEYCAPNKAGEYIASGLALFTTNNPSLTYIEADGIGVCCDPGSDDSVLEKLRLLCDTEHLQTCKERACERFATELNYEPECRPLVQRCDEWMGRGNA